MQFKTVAVIGLGYIGLPTAAIFAKYGTQVIGVDVNEAAVNTINQGKIHIVEPDLDVVIADAVKSGKLKAVTRPEPADAFLIAVPTPFKGKGHEPNLEYIEAATKSIAPVLKPGDLVVLESTVPVGATEKMAAWLAEERADLTFPQQEGEKSDIRIAHCPERVLPGQILKELVSNDRIIGGMTPLCAQAASTLYSLFLKGEAIKTCARTAELCKLTENSFRDVNIAFANELSIICDKLGVDVWELINLANRHPRVHVLQPGPGVGGHCIAVDPWFIIDRAPEEARLIKKARVINDSKPDWVLSKIEQTVQSLLQSNVEKKREDITIVCYGLSFKPDIDDLRGSPAAYIYKELVNTHPGKVFAVEPNFSESLIRSNDFFVKHISEVKGDIGVVLVKHSEFLPDIIRQNNLLLVDCVGMFN